MNRARRVFTAEFKINAVNLVLNEHRKPTEVARSLNISPKTMSSWLRQQREGRLTGKIVAGTTQSEMDVSAIIAENQRLKEEVLLLKKFGAYLAKHGLA